MIQRAGLRGQEEGDGQGGKANLRVLLRLSLLAVGLNYANASRKTAQDASQKCAPEGERAGMLIYELLLHWLTLPSKVSTPYTSKLLLLKTPVQKAREGLLDVGFGQHEIGRSPHGIIYPIHC